MCLNGIIFIIMSHESADLSEAWRRPQSFAAMGSMLMHVSEVVAAQEPPDPYAVEYSQRLLVGLGATTRDELPYEALRRSETRGMWLRYGVGGRAPASEPGVTPAWAQSVQGVDALVAAQLTNPEA